MCTVKNDGMTKMWIAHQDGEPPHLVELPAGYDFPGFDKPTSDNIMKAIRECEWLIDHGWTCHEGLSVLRKYHGDHFIRIGSSGQSE